MALAGYGSIRSMLCSLKLWQQRRDEDVPYGPYRSGRWCLDASPCTNGAKLVGKRHWGTIFHIQVCPPQVWLNLWIAWSPAIFDTFSLHFVMYVYLCEFDTVLVDTWYSSATVFTDLPDSRYPMKLNHAISINTSVSHSKIKQ